MANQLAQQMLKNLAEKAGQSDNQKPTSGKKTITTMNMKPQEEQMLIDLIHLRNTLYPSKPVALSKGQDQLHSPRGEPGDKMISLSELACKSR